MKERPILMSAPMVRAILAGRKTQTRRIARFFNEDEAGNDCAKQFNPRFENGVWKAAHAGYECDCPYGVRGDRLWVKETHSTDFAHYYPCDRIWYRADDDRASIIEHRKGVQGIESDAKDRLTGKRVFVPFKWRPSIFMRRSDSRITLEVTGIRVERLQKISERDAIAEGIERDGDGWRAYVDGHLRRLAFPQNSYKTLWESINGPGSWDANPWVWVVEFRRI